LVSILKDRLSGEKKNNDEHNNKYLERKIAEAIVKNSKENPFLSKKESLLTKLIEAIPSETKKAIFEMENLGPDHINNLPKNDKELLWKRAKEKLAEKQEEKIEEKDMYTLLGKNSEELCTRLNENNSDPSTIIALKNKIKYGTTEEVLKLYEKLNEEKNAKVREYIRENLKERLETGAVPESHKKQVEEITKQLQSEAKKIENDVLLKEILSGSFNKNKISRMKEEIESMGENQILGTLSTIDTFKDVFPKEAKKLQLEQLIEVYDVFLTMEKKLANIA
jgi:hypothetical protein